MSTNNGYSDTVNAQRAHGSNNSYQQSSSVITCAIVGAVIGTLVGLFILNINR